MHCFADCSIAVIVKLENDAKDRQGLLAGRFERSDDVNGKPSYKKGESCWYCWNSHEYAIWYSKDINGYWMLGDFDSIGSDEGGIIAQNEFEGLTDERNNWYYTFNDKWIKAEKNDIVVKCSQ